MDTVELVCGRFVMKFYEDELRLRLFVVGNRVFYTSKSLVISTCDVA